MMQRRRLALLAPALLLDQTTWAQEPVPLRIASFPGRDAQAQVAQRLLDEIYRQSVLTLRTVLLPPARSSLDIQAGEIDGELIRTRAYGLQHPQLLRVEPAYYRITVHAFSLLTRRLQLRKRADLAPYSLGALRGVSYVPEIAAGHKALTLTQNSEQLLRMLQAGRVDVALDGLLSGLVTLARLGLADRVSISAELGRFELFHYLRASQRHAAQRLGETIGRMRVSGELERLTKQHETAVLAETSPSPSPSSYP